MRARFVVILLLTSAVALLGAAPPSPIAGASGRVVYVGADGSLDRLDVGSGKQIQLVSGAGRILHNPVWSPDGTTIAFLAAPAIQQPGRVDDIYTVTADGGTPRKLTRLGRPLHDLAWFPDGHRLLFATGFNGGFQTHVLHLDDGAIVDFPTATDPSMSYADQLNPRRSPDGSLVAALQTQAFADGTSQQGIYVSDADGQNGMLAVDFGTSTDHFLSSPSWSPDGAIVYGDEAGLNEALLDGSPPTTIVDIGTQISSPVAYAPDGGRLAAPAVRGYQQTSGGFSLPSWGLLLVDADGSNPQVLDVGGRQLGLTSPIEWAGPDVLFFTASQNGIGSGATLFAVRKDGTGLTAIVDLGEFADFDWHP